MLEIADAAAGDERFGADAGQRGDGVGAPPQQWQRRGDQPGAQHAENGQNILDDVRHLDADDGVGGSPMRRSRPAIAEIMRSASA